ncbi:MAG: SpoIIIAH-like family protein [Clostridia bacterium]|nr:SpoIIIAH-like family protein [Clostridia bacterium]
MKVIKRGQLAMLSISFMIMIAGYINYKYDPKREENLGQTMKVDSDQVYLFSSSKDVDVYADVTASLDKNETIYNNKNSESSLTTFKTSRDNMFSELEENYTEVISKSASTEEAKIYQEKLDGVVKKKHLIDIVEGIIKAKGITEIVIVPTDDKYNVMVKMDSKLTDAQANMIQKIIEDEFNVEADKVRIIEQ